MPLYPTFGLELLSGFSLVWEELKTNVKRAYRYRYIHIPYMEIYIDIDIERRQGRDWKEGSGRRRGRRYE